MTIKSILNAYNGPVRVIYEPTIDCNLKCPMCDRTHKAEYNKHKSNQLSIDLALQFLRDIASMGVENILLIGGGEPLMHPDIQEIINLIKRNNIHLHLWTNGTLINEKNVGFFASNCDIITVSLDSPYSDINDQLRGAHGATQKSINALRLLRQYNKNLYLRIHSVLSGRNIPHLNDFLPLIDEIGINEVGGAYVNPFSFVPHDFLIPDGRKDEFDMNVNKFCQALKNRGIALAGCYNPISKIIIDDVKKQFTLNDEPFKHITCLGLWSQATVRPNGDVSVCCFSYKPVLGNLHEMSFPEIWNSERANNLRKVVLKGDYLDAPCRNCDLGDPVFTRLLEKGKDMSIFNHMINVSR